MLQSHGQPDLDRPWKLTQLGLLTLAMMPVLGALLLIASSGLVTRRRWGKMKGRSLNRGLLLLSLLLILSSALSHRPDEAWLGLAHFVPYFWLMAAQAELIASPKQIQQAATILGLTIAPLVVIGLGELYLGWSTPPGWVGILPWPSVAGGTPPGRMASVFGYANNLALYLNMGLALLLGLWGRCYKSGMSRFPGRLSGHLSGAVASPSSAFEPDGIGTDVASTARTTVISMEAGANQAANLAPGQAFEPSSSQTSYPVANPVPKPAANPAANPVGHAWALPPGDRTGEPWLSTGARSPQLLLWTLLIVLCLVGLILTQSRSAWGLAMLSGLAMALYWGWTWLVAVVLGFGGSILWAAFGPWGKGPLRLVIPEFFWARLTDQNFSDRPLATLRITQWRFALDLAEARPLTGWGLRNFSPLYEAATGTWMGHPHNLFLMLSAETGWFITGGLLGLIGLIFYRGIEVIRAKDHLNAADCYLFFGVLIAFQNTVFFHLFDVPLFDFRINALGWITVSQILGVVYLSKAGNLNLGRTEQLKPD